MSYCESCSCLTLAQNDQGLCESCLMVKINNNKIKFEQRSIDSVEQLDIDKIQRSFISQPNKHILSCDFCNKTQFLVPLSCSCQSLISCEQCANTKRKKCEGCGTKPNLLCWDIQSHFNATNTFDCPWCEAKGIAVETFLKYHLESIEQCVEVVDMTGHVARMKKGMRRMYKNLTLEASQMYTKVTNEKFEKIKDDLYKPSNPLSRFYEHLAPKRLMSSRPPVSSYPKTSRMAKRRHFGHLVSNYT